jgi:myo-inositol-1(or 4)-monophosphatase
MDLEVLCNQVIDLAKNTGNYIREQGKLFNTKEVETKGTHDFVTYVDKTSESKLVRGLSEILPEAGFIVEENTSQKKGEVYQWIIDPLDGTTNFIHGLPPYAISIALMKNQEIVLGVVHEISLNECFYAWKGGKAFLDGKQINVTLTNKVENALIATGFPYYDYKRIKPFMGTLAYFMKNSHGVRRLGSAATDLAYVACGRFDAFYEYSLHAWDVAAGVIIIREAGGDIADFNGGQNYLFGKEIIATNANLFMEFSEIVSGYMNKDI